MKSSERVPGWDVVSLVTVSNTLKPCEQWSGQPIKQERCASSSSRRNEKTNGADRGASPTYSTREDFMGIVSQYRDHAICKCDACGADFYSESPWDSELCDDCAQKEWEREEARRAVEAEQDVNERNGIYR